MDNTKQTKRKFLAVDEETYKKVRLYCFLRDINIRKFTIQTMQDKLQPYEQWLKNIKKIKAG